MSVMVETYATLADAAATMHQGSRYLGGGTLVMAASNYGDQSFDRIVRSTDSSLSDISYQQGNLRIGASVTMAQVMAARELDFLAPVAMSIAGPAVRNMATVGGNLFAESPFGDFGVALLALGAVVEMTGGQRMNIEEFFDRRSSLNGLVTGVAVPSPEHGAFRYRKVTRTKPKGASVLSIAALLPGGSRISGARIAFGAMAPTPRRSPGAEAGLEGMSLDAGNIARALERCVDGLEPKDDAISTAWYRREVAPVHLRRLLLGENS